MQRERFWRIMAQSVASLLELAIHENIANLLSCPAGLRYLPISLYILCESDLWWKSSLRSSQSSPATRTTTARRLRQNECGSSVVVEQEAIWRRQFFFQGDDCLSSDRILWKILAWGGDQARSVDTALRRFFVIGWESWKVNFPRVPRGRLLLIGPFKRPASTGFE